MLTTNLIKGAYNITHASKSFNVKDLLFIYYNLRIFLQFISKIYKRIVKEHSLN